MAHNFFVGSASKGVVASSHSLFVLCHGLLQGQKPACTPWDCMSVISPHLATRHQYSSPTVDESLKDLAESGVDNVGARVSSGDGLDQWLSIHVNILSYDG